MAGRIEGAHKIGQQYTVEGEVLNDYERQIADLRAALIEERATVLMERAWHGGESMPTGRVDDYREQAREELQREGTL